MLIYLIKFIWWIYMAIEYDQYKSYFCWVMIESFRSINEADVFFELLEKIFDTLIGFIERLNIKNILNAKDGETN